MRTFVIGVVVHKLVVKTTLSLQRLKDPVLYCQRLFVVQCTSFVVGTKDLVNSYHQCTKLGPSIRHKYYERLYCLRLFVVVSEV